MILLLSSALVKPQLEYCGQVWAPQYTRCMNMLQSPEKDQEDDYRADERKERDLGWLSLEKAQGGAYQCT